MELLHLMRIFLWKAGNYSILQMKNFFCGIKEE